MRDAERAGLPAELVGQIEEAQQDRAGWFEVWPVNMPIVDAFLAIATQWRTAAIADGRVLWLGLDYAAVRVGLAMERIKLSPRQWRGLVTMERAASDALNGTAG